MKHTEVFGSPGMSPGPITFRAHAHVDIGSGIRSVDYAAIEFTVGSGTQRNTNYYVRVPGEQFPKLALAMMAADPTAATEAFGQALQHVRDAAGRLGEIREQEYDLLFGHSDGA
jgi:YD repeat-containing protein